MVWRRSLKLIGVCWILASISTSTQADFTEVSSADWDNAAVRSVLHTFAFGGLATDVQIQTWADLPPVTAINEILTFAPTNDLLSPSEDVTPTKLLVGGEDRTLEGLQDWWFSGDADNLLPERREHYHPRSGTSNNFQTRSLQNTWIEATTKRGVNPFRQRVGLWLTNYLMSIHLSPLGGNVIMIRTMYDDVMRALANNQPFAEILTIGATSAGIARQYGHRSNRFNNTTGVLSGNDDFAREYHQLFFAILGQCVPASPQPCDPVLYDDYYEDITVENTAKALTGMRILYGDVYGMNKELPNIDFISAVNLQNHHMADLEILNFANPGVLNITGTNAGQKIANLSAAAINHPESKRNLPLWVVRHFADTGIVDMSADPILQQEIRDTWDTVNMNLLDFLREYAISTQFHRSDRVKYLTAFERNMTTTMLNTLTNEEAYALYETGNSANRSPKTRMERQSAELFKPAHFVFGGQTGADAIGSSDIFKEAYNANVNSPNFLAKADDSTPAWQKDWGAVIPPDGNGDHLAGDVALWLWNRFVPHAAARYTIQERAVLSSLLSAGKDFPTLVEDGGLPQQTVAQGYASSDLNDAGQAYLGLIQTSEQTVLDLQTVEDNFRIGMAINFISATPFMFTQTGGDL